LAKFDLKEYARDGAAARVTELEQELADIYRVFPDLRRGRPSGPRTATSARSATRRRRPAMSAAQRKAVGERMKKYWAERRKAQSVSKK
jgi:hypothetical protein